jgi:hypothetical protein
MKQTSVPNGWLIGFRPSWAVVAVLSTATFGATLTGCGGGVDSADYEVILDQPETSPSAPLKSTKVVLTDTANAGVTSNSEAVTTTPDDHTGPQQPAEAALAGQNVVPGSPANPQDDPIGGATPSESPASSPTPAETAAAVNEGTTDKPVADAGSSTPKADDPAQATTKSEPKELVEPRQPRIVTLLIPDKEFKAEGKGAEQALRVSFDDFDLLKVLNMEPVTEDAPSRMPKWLKDLDGKRVRVRGFMFPPFEAENIRAFTLARDNQICCFGRNPLVYDLVDIFMRKGESTDYIQNRPFDVIGVFHIGDSIIPGELYSMDDAVVIDR